MSQLTNSIAQPVPLDQRQTTSLLICAIALVSVFYNGGLSIINAHVMPLGFAHVALVEILTLVAALSLLLYRGIYEEDALVVAFVIFNLVLAAYIAAINRAIFVDFFRNALIIGSFALLGTRTNQRTIIVTFRVACIVVVSVLIVETLSTKTYEDIFSPADYFRNTRGLEQLSFDGSKLFQNSVKIPGRFSFNIADHRTSSVFVEQVSLANFSGVLLIYLTSMFRSIRVSDRVLFIFTIALILVTNDSRTMLMFAGVCFVGYFLFPRLHKLFTLAVMPLVLIGGYLVYLISPDATGDDLDGRVVLTVHKMMELDFASVFGLGISGIGDLMDSGYVYVVVASTVFGLLTLWLFTCLFPAGETSIQKRCAYSLSIFIFVNMMIGGTAVFSIKIAALLWLLVGHIKVSGGSEQSP